MAVAQAALVAPREPVLPVRSADQNRRFGCNPAHVAAKDAGMGCDSTGKCFILGSLWAPPDACRTARSGSVVIMH